MSFEPPKPSFTLTEHVREFEIDELDTVTISDPVLSDEGREVPAGSVGTVVAVWGRAAAFEVEFESPFHALATVDARLVTKTKR